MTRPSLKSRFGEQIRAFVGYKNSLGFPYNESIRILGRFDDFCVERFPEKDCLDCELALAWLEKRDTENTAGHRNRIMVIREFANKTRVVPILPKTAEHLRSYLKKFHPAENRKRDDYVFYAYGGPQRPMSPDTVAAFVKKYGESARHVCTSIPERVHPHMLRHTRAMHLYQDGVPLAMVSEFLGHAQIETTKIYAHADTEMKRKAIQQAANKLNDTIPDALWNTDDEEMMLKLRGKQQYK